METTTLKLTDTECRIIPNNTTKYARIVDGGIEDGSGGVIEVYNIDKFREFLCNELKKVRKSGLFIESIRSILQKLAFVCVELNSSPMIGFDDKEVK